MTKSLYSLVTIILTCTLYGFGQLEISSNGRYLVDRDQAPFFWLGDTGWGLFQVPNRKEIRRYLKSRAKQGFTVVHASACHLNPFIKPDLQNSDGDMAFINVNLLKPLITKGNNPKNELEYDYWDHIEFVIREARKHKIYINFLPLFNMAEDDGYNLIDLNNAESYGKFLGERFKNHPNLIWCMGGDVLADNDLRKSIWNQLAAGILEGLDAQGKDEVLMTFHVRGGHSSSEYFQNTPWLDFHMLQTWDKYTSIYDRVTEDYLKSPTKPILHGEGAYEDGPEYPTKPITPHIIRKQFYWASFAGGMHTYGNSNVWSFGSNKDYISKPWKDALKSEGAKNLSIARKIMESVQWYALSPCLDIFKEGQGSAKDLNVAMCSKGHERLVVYCAAACSIKLDLTKNSKGGYKSAYWINPINGKHLRIKNRNLTSTQHFSVPSNWEDGILLVE
ncbi:MAG: DUF4038 domain-containing protein [Saprospiraceae bacterium]|nr:DUF4038 domain-containing protein [Saprospiraceae bacterium]